MCVPCGKSGTMSTNDVPQRDNIIIARGRHAEGRRFAAASAVVVGIKGFDVMLPGGNPPVRRDGPFRLRALGRQDALRARATDAIELRGVGQRGLLVVLVLRCQD